MKTIRELGNKVLRWQPSVESKESWELRSGDDVVGTVAWQNPTRDGTLVVATSADGHWSFKRVGVFIPRVTVRIVGTDTDVATVTPHLGRSVVDFADGHTVHLLRRGFWHNEFALTQSNGEPLLVFKEAGTRVEIEKGAEARSDASLLALLGCYLLHLYARDAESAATTVILSGALS
jgi:hypothetical protein